MFSSSKRDRVTSAPVAYSQSSGLWLAMHRPQAGLLPSHFCKYSSRRGASDTTMGGFYIPLSACGTGGMMHCLQEACDGVISLSRVLLVVGVCQYRMDLHGELYW